MKEVILVLSFYVEGNWNKNDVFSNESNDYSNYLDIITSFFLPVFGSVQIPDILKRIIDMIIMPEKMAKKKSSLRIIMK